MNITLKNIGTLKEASFDLDKDFIVFIGPNNTGKTYAAYCLYGLCKNYVYFRQYSDKFLSKKLFDTLVSQGKMQLDLFEFFDEEMVNLVYDILKKSFINFLPQLFGLDRTFFSEADISFNLSNRDNFKRYILQLELNTGLGNGSGAYVAGLKEKNSSLYTLTSTKDSKKIDESFTDFLLQTVTYRIFHPLVQNWGVHFLPAERIGVSVFSKDLFSNRFTKTNEILNIQNRNNAIDLLNKEFNTYSLVVQDAINSYERILRKSNPNDSPAEFQNLATELETHLLNGKININNDGDVFYQTNNTKDIKIQATGSIIKSLTGLLFYLRYSATKGQLLIIDEPEINLHPDNQRLVARILAKLSKLGVKVIVSTHSDYFIRELNNLMMLNKQHPETQALREKYGYDESEILDYTRVGAYLFKDNKATALPVTDTGMEAATIDEEINRLNNTANDIYWTLFED